MQSTLVSALGMRKSPFQSCGLRMKGAFLYYLLQYTQCLFYDFILYSFFAQLLYAFAIAQSENNVYATFHADYLTLCPAGFFSIMPAPYLVTVHFTVIVAAA